MVSILGPEDAYACVREGRIGTVLVRAISAHFTWAEVFIHCSEKEIAHCPKPVFLNAVKQAAVLEQIRALYHRPIIVHSWYRSPLHNARVGGKPRSYHPQGLATDFHIQGWESTQDNKTLQHHLDPLPFMQACGLEFTNGAWTHVDTRGYKARFTA